MSIVAVWLCATSAQAATPVTTLGITAEEIAVWNSRRVSGPYKSAGDVSTNSPGDWDRIATNASSFASSPSTGRWTTGPTNKIGACINKDAGGSNDPPSSAEGWANRLRDAAFSDLVQGTTTHRANIKSELLWQATQSWANFSNASLWCTGVIFDINPGFIISAWLTKILFAYDYVGRAAFTSGELTTMDNWFWHAADFWRLDVDTGLDGVFVNRWAGNYTTTQSECTVFGPTDAYSGGPTLALYNKYNNNRRGSLLRFSTLTAIYLDEVGFSPPSSRSGATLSTLKTSGKMFVKEWIRFALLPQGVTGEFERRETGTPDLGWAYSTATLGESLGIAMAFARQGDTELFTHTTALGACNSVGTINDGGGRVGQNKDLLFGAQAHLKYVSDTYARYWPSGTNNDDRLDGRMPRSGATWHSVADTFVVPANIYFRDATVKSTYMRTQAGTVAYPASPVSTTAVPAFTGENGLYPGVLFMFGQMEDNAANPFNDSPPAPSGSGQLELRVIRRLQ